MMKAKAFIFLAVKLGARISYLSYSNALVAKWQTR